MAKSKGFYGITGFALVIIVFIANALGGTPYYLNKAHPTCYDGIDNDNYDMLLPKADFEDGDCLVAPFDFGAGEGAHGDTQFTTGYPTFLPGTDPVFSAYAETWNTTGNAYPTLYEFLTVHYYDEAPCGKANTVTGQPAYNVEQLLNFWRLEYNVNDDKTGYDQYLENCV